MAKDPAFLFYYQDFLVGTEFLTEAECGCYIRILCHMADKGRLPIEHMLSICKAYGFTDALKSKFLIDENGLFYNKRLEFEVQKRRNYIQSRRNNAKKDEKAYAKHMENENENENINEEHINNSIKNIYSVRFEEIWKQYPKPIGKKQALKYFLESVKTEQDVLDIKKAFLNYKNSRRFKSGFIQNGSTWFNNWRDWVNYVETAEVMKDKKPQQYIPSADETLKEMEKWKQNT